MGNSLQNNPPSGQVNVTSGGVDWAWAVCAVMTVSLLVTTFWGRMQPVGTRTFHHLATVILFVSAVSWFAIASDLGEASVATEFGHSDGPAGRTREVFWVRYIQWAINATLIVITVLLATGLALSDIFLTAFFAFVIPIMGLVGAFTASSYKWGFFVFGLFALGYLLSSFWGIGTRSSFAAGTAHRSIYTTGAGYISFIWPLYFLAWGLCEGGNVIRPTGEMIWYGILDILAGPVFLFLHLGRLRSLDYAAFGLNSGKYTDSGAGGVGTTPATRAKASEAGAV